MTKYDELARWAESDAPDIRADAVVRRGTPENHAAVRAMLEDAAESPAEVALLERSSGGRPSLHAGEPDGKSPQWQIRAPKDLDAAFRAQADAEGRSFSEVLRDAAAEYLAKHAS
jgi:hypothetical protein